MSISSFLLLCKRFYSNYNLKYGSCSEDIWVLVLCHLIPPFIYFFYFLYLLWSKSRKILSKERCLHSSLPLQICGMMVWILLGGTEYFHLSALCWVMFFATSCWVLTICLFIVYLTGAHSRMSQVPWTALVTQTHIDGRLLYFFYEGFSALSASRHSDFLCLRVRISSLLGSLCLLVAV